MPSAPGGRSPDLYVRYSGETARVRVEIANITEASPDYRPDARVDRRGRLSSKMTREEIPDKPNKTRVALPTNEFKDTAIRKAILGKIKSTASCPSQLQAQNPNTVAGDAPMAVGGDIVVRVTHGTVDKARLDQMIEELKPELVNAGVRRVQVDAVSTADPSAGRALCRGSDVGVCGGEPPVGLVAEAVNDQMRWWMVAVFYRGQRAVDRGRRVTHRFPSRVRVQASDGTTFYEIYTAGPPPGP